MSRVDVKGAEEDHVFYLFFQKQKIVRQYRQKNQQQKINNKKINLLASVAAQTATGLVNSL
jgi:hypothetical protein